MRIVHAVSYGLLLGVIALSVDCGDDDGHHYPRASAYHGYSGYSYGSGASYYANPVRNAPVYAHDYSYYSPYYNYYSSPSYNVSLQTYLACRHGYYVYNQWGGYSCYFPGTYYYYEAAARNLDLAFESLWQGDWNLIDDSLRSAQAALPGGDPDLMVLDSLRHDAQRRDIERERLAQSMADLLGRWSTRLAGAQVLRR